MESTDLSSGPLPQPHLPPGFRFHPTDEELVVHYLKKKASSAPLPVSIIAEVDLYKFDPWELPAKATFGEQEWYFFSPRDRKYPNGARPNRAATSGYWKATGTDKPVLTAGGTQKVGVKKALVFYGGKPPKGIKTNWIMHEYRLVDNKVNNKPPGCDLGNKKNSLRLDDWVLCRIYKKSNTTTRPLDHDKEDSMEDNYMLGSIPPSLHISSSTHHLTKAGYGGLFEPNSHDHTIMFEGMLSSNDSATAAAISAHHLAFKAAAFPVVPATNPFRRTLPSWNDQEDSANLSPSNKRFHADHNSEGSITRTDEMNNSSSSHTSVASFLSQMTQTPPLHQQQTLVGDGVFRSSPYLLPGINWYT